MYVMTVRATVSNIFNSKGWVFCSNDSLVVAETLVLRLLYSY